MIWGPQLCSSFQLLVGDESSEVTNGKTLNWRPWWSLDPTRPTIESSLRVRLTGMVKATGQRKHSAASKGKEVEVVACAGRSSAAASLGFSTKAQAELFRIGVETQRVQASQVLGGFMGCKDHTLHCGVALWNIFEYTWQILTAM